MQTVFTADHPAEAHMMCHMLEREGITTHIQGEFLQGAIGELPASKLTKIMVPDDETKRAREIVEHWEKQSPKSDAKPSSYTKKANYLKEKIIAFLLGCLCMWILLSVNQ